VVESIGPKLEFEVSTEQERANGVRTREMPSFDGTVLIGSVSTSRTHIIPKAGEEAYDGRIVIQLATLIKEDVLARTFRSMMFKEVA
jgi:hypothetical protein